MDPNSNRCRVLDLVARGVLIPCPDAVEITPDVSPTAIAHGVVIHSGCRISGADTSIGPGCELGAEAPATVESCQLGKRVQLKGGYLSGATFLDGSNMGSGAHVRPGTLLEEEAGGAHSVGLKQTIFLPFATAGSLINFCDALLAGGTSRKDHSEIGSSYIHFNFTPHQDKATPSLVGDVPRGVMLREPPIFLGGQGGLIGPVRIAYGTVIAAGTICRQDILDNNQLFAAKVGCAPEPQPYRTGGYRSIDRIVRNNLIYIGNIWALRAWYSVARKKLMQGDPFAAACHRGALARIDSVLEERVRRLRELAGKMPRSLLLAREQLGADLPARPYGQQQVLIDRWPEMERKLHAAPSDGLCADRRDDFLREWERVDSGIAYPQAVGGLSSGARSAGSAWLQAIVDSYASLWP